MSPRKNALRIAIVGAGLAGCHLAHRLAEQEHQILLFDPRAPWEKPCGGGLGPVVRRHFPDVLALPFPRRSPTRLLLRASDGSQVERTFERPPWSIVSRRDLGRALLERALTNRQVRLVRQGVVDLEQAGEGWRVKIASGEVFSADSVVGADGVRSIVRRRLVGPIPRQHLALALGCFVRGAPAAIIFQTCSDLEGYLWSFPRPACSERSRGNLASVGIGSRLGALPAREMRQRLDRFLDDLCPGASKACPEGSRGEGRWAALLPLARDPTLWDTPCVGPGWALLGDAAGHVQPITGEGIAYALWSAELLAQAFADRDPLAYEELWRARYGRDLARAAEMLRSSTASHVGTYEVLFHLSLTAAMEGAGL